MFPALTPPAHASFLGIPLVIFSVLIPVIGISLFVFIMVKRLAPLTLASPDPRLNRFPERLFRVFKLWLGQYRHPRYLTAGIIHILLFAGFLILGLRSFSMMIIGIDPDFVPIGFQGILGTIYHVLKDYAATWILAVCLIAMIRRLFFRPERYAVPAKYGENHTREAILVLCLICTLVITDGLFDGSLAAAAGNRPEGRLPPGTLAWMFQGFLSNAPTKILQYLHVAAYFIHDLVFFGFLCFLPMGKHFHVITSLFNVFFMRLDKGHVKPVRHGVSDEGLDDLASFGVKKLEDFTWKHILDFYTCVDCGRCSDNCPANAAGRPLSPRFISIKGRDYTFDRYPLRGLFQKSEPLMGTVYDEDEIWSCTTCGACEAECPVTIEYIDKIVDLRRGMVEEGMVPQSLQKPLRALEKRGNPWGKMERKRADWTKEKVFSKTCRVKVIDKKNTADTLYFVDSITSFDDRMQDIARAASRILTEGRVDFGILGKAEKDSGHEVRRFGEEMLFQDLRDQNTIAIEKSGAARIVTADPHAFNALKNDYADLPLPPTAHISEVIDRMIRAHEIRLKPADAGKVYTYHDPCYLGRHNDLYDTPRTVIDAIPDIQRVEMKKCRDRSFCCGGGGLMLFYEPEEEERMGVLRVNMAKQAGANVIITACPFCLVNIEDAVKVAGLEGEMTAMDLCELVDLHMRTDLLTDK